MVSVACLSGSAVSEFGETEIEQLDSGLGDHNMGGLQVATYDAFLVRGIERVENLCCKFQRLIERERTFKR
jgi:hypothetical protein